MAVGLTRRISRGRGHSYEIDGEPVDGVTWAKDNGLPSRGLIDWAGKATAAAAVDRWEELSGENPLTRRPFTPSERLKILEGARFESRDEAANRGTQVHKFALALAAGEEVQVPEAIAGHVDAYLLFVAEWKPEEMLVETPVYNRTLGYAGTLDLIARLVDGAVWLLDWKTSRSGIWPDTALQLAAYRFAEFYLDADGNEQPLPVIERAGGVWLRSDGYDLHPVNASEKVFRLWRYARELARYSEARRAEYVGDAINPLGREVAA